MNNSAPAISPAATATGIRLKRRARTAGDDSDPVHEPDAALDHDVGLGHVDRGEQVGVGGVELLEVAVRQIAVEHALGLDEQQPLVHRRRRVGVGGQQRERHRRQGQGERDGRTPRRRVAQQYLEAPSARAVWDRRSPRQELPRERLRMCRRACRERRWCRISPGLRRALLAALAALVAMGIALAILTQAGRFPDVKLRFAPGWALLRGARLPRLRARARDAVGAMSGSSASGARSRRSRGCARGACPRWAATCHPAC